MQLSVVLICWNSLSHLREALASLQDTLTAATDSEIILIDNGSTDGTDHFIAQHYPQVVYHRLPVNKGVAFARNRGIEQARGKYIWLLDDDTVANREALAQMIQYMQEHPQCGICGCRLVNARGETQESYKPYPSLTELFDFFDSRELASILPLEGEGCVLPRLRFDQCNATNISTGPLMRRQEVHHFPCVSHD